MTEARGTRLIDLAPGHKQGMVVSNPVLLGAGSVGLGDAKHPELETAALGAIVVGPLTWQSRAGSAPPRVASLPGAMVLETGAQNRGLEATLRKVAPIWARLGAPVVVQVAEWGPHLGRLARRLATVKGVAAIELLLPPDGDAASVRRLLEPLAQECDLPVWAKLAHAPPRAVQAAAQAALEAGAAALVVAQPPVGSGLAGEHSVTGSLYGPATFAQTLYVLAAVAELGLPAPLIASGGIFSEAQARAALAAGASALQLDAVAWIEPTLPAHLAHLLGAS